MTDTAILTEVDYRSGQRADGLDPRDENLQCYGWQCLGHEDGGDFELRVVEDERDTSQYGGGSVILDNGETITDPANLTMVTDKTAVADVNGTILLTDESVIDAVKNWF
jgi:hypothetical protein